MLILRWQFGVDLLGTGARVGLLDQCITGQRLAAIEQAAAGSEQAAILIVPQEQLFNTETVEFKVALLAP